VSERGKIPSEWDRMRIAPHFARGSTDPMYREFIDRGRIRPGVPGITESVIVGSPAAKIYFGLIVSSPRIVTDSDWASLPNIGLRVELFKGDGSVIAAKSFRLQQMTRRSAPDAKGIYPPLGDQYQAFAYLDQVREAVWKLDTGKAYLCRVTVEEPKEMPSGLELTAVALWPGTKQVTMAVFGEDL
jgi:hypothetical protein